MPQLHEDLGIWIFYHQDVGWGHYKLIKIKYMIYNLFPQSPYIYIHITFVFLQAVFCSQKTNHETWQKQVSRQVLDIGEKFFQWSFHPGWLLLSYCWLFRNPANSSPEIYTNGMLKKNNLNWWVCRNFWTINSTTRVTNEKQKTTQMSPRMSGT